VSDAVEGNGLVSFHGIRTDMGNIGAIPRNNNPFQRSLQGFQERPGPRKYNGLHQSGSAYRWKSLGSNPALSMAIVAPAAQLFSSSLMIPDECRVSLQFHSGKKRKPAGVVASCD
jgi:hypothetical protein